MILFFSKTGKPKNNHVVNILRSYTVFLAEKFLVCFDGEAFEFYYMKLLFDARITSEVCSSYLAKNMPQNNYWSFDKINIIKQATMFT